MEWTLKSQYSSCSLSSSIYTMRGLVQVISKFPCFSDILELLKCRYKIKLCPLVISGVWVEFPIKNKQVSEFPTGLEEQRQTTGSSFLFLKSMANAWMRALYVLPAPNALPELMDWMLTRNSGCAEWTLSDYISRVGWDAQFSSE